MELDKVTVIFESLNSMFSHDKTKVRKLLSENYNPSDISAGFFFDDKGKMCKKSVSKYHAIIIQQQTEDGDTLAFIVNETKDPKQKAVQEANPYES
jgi:hypothetical protein